MAPVSNPVKLFKEEIVKTRTFSGKLVKIQSQIDSLKEEKSKIKDLDLPICTQFLDHAINSLDLEHDKVSATIKCILNQSRITDAREFQEEIIRVFHNPSLAPTNTEPQPQPQLSAQPVPPRPPLLEQLSSMQQFYYQPSL